MNGVGGSLGAALAFFDCYSCYDLYMGCKGVMTEGQLDGCPSVIVGCKDGPHSALQRFMPANTMLCNAYYGV